RKSKKPSLLVVNKADNTQREEETAEFYKFGLGEPVPISALSGRNTGDLLDRIVEGLGNKLKKKPKEKKVDFDEAIDEEAIDIKPKKLTKNKSIKVAIIGRPNVGKSSLFNALLDQNRAIVSDIPGTTRDIISTVFKYKEENIEFIDTAGLRRRGKIGKTTPATKKEGRIERYSAMRSLKSIDEADICLILVDAMEGIVAQDLHLAGFVKDSYKGIIIIINKVDEAENVNPETYLNVLKRKFDFLPFASAIFLSAKTGKNVKKVFDILLEIKKAREVEIPTPKLNKFLEKITIKNPPAGLKNKKPKMKYITQTGINPPSFTIFTSYANLIHFSYERYIENQLRKEFDFNGTSIRIVFRSKQGDKSGNR
ncbi:ribosome biogenesis GTPase Der, partial [bacterium (Candidatus Howlettbacteria) CG_4_10_14_0_8_um_filter_40_9]